MFEMYTAFGAAKCELDLGEGKETPNDGWL